MAIQIDRDREWFPMMNKILGKLDKIEEQIGLVKSNTELQLKAFDKVIQPSKQAMVTHKHTDFK